MPEPKVSKTHVRQDNTAVFHCPHCGRQKAIPVDKLRGHKHKLKVECGCKETFTVNLEFRQRVRKKTYLRGTYINHSQKGGGGDLYIKNISVVGLEFTSLNVQGFKVDDELALEFNLDNKEYSMVFKLFGFYRRFDFIFAFDEIGEIPLRKVKVKSINITDVCDYQGKSISDHLALKAVLHVD